MNIDKNREGFFWQFVFPHVLKIQIPSSSLLSSSTLVLLILVLLFVILLSANTVSCE